MVLVKASWVGWPQPGVTVTPMVGRNDSSLLTVTLRWAEQQSRDTNENARYSVAMLQADGITRLVLVTHGFHQRRALAAFQRAIAASGRPLQMVAAPVGLRPPPTGELSDYLPGSQGLLDSSLALHEWLGRLAGA